MADEISKSTDRADTPRGAGYVIKELTRVIVGLVVVALIIAGGYWLVGPNAGKAPESQPAATADTSGGQAAPVPAKTADEAQTVAPPPAAVPAQPPAAAPAPAPAPVQTQAAAPPPNAADAGSSPAMAEASPPVAPPSPPPAPVSPASVGKPGITAVQFASEPTEASAKREWQRLQKRLPDLLGNRQADITKVDHAGRVSWRLRTGGFDDSTQATQFCGRVHAKGYACTVSTPE